MQDLVKLCKHTGERFDLVQAGGGNVSMKKDGILYIKASGYHLSEIEVEKGIVSVKNSTVLEILQDRELATKKRKEQETLVNKKLSSLFSGTLRPSIELFMHSLFNAYTLHTHPLAVNTILCSKNAESIIQKLYPRSLFIEYATPGLFLSRKILEKHDQYIENNNKRPKIAFLKNHGLVVSDNTIESTLALQEDIIRRCEQFIGMDYSRYKGTNKISETINEIFGENIISYLCEDLHIKENISKLQQSELTIPTFPDQLVYCGFKTVAVENTDDHTPLLAYKNEFREHPKLIIFHGNLFIIARNMKKAREIEDVCKSFLLINNNIENICYLPEKEQLYLANWEAEDFRRNV